MRKLWIRNPPVQANTHTTNSPFAKLHERLHKCTSVCLYTQFRLGGNSRTAFVQGANKDLLGSRCDIMHFQILYSPKDIDNTFSKPWSSAYTLSAVKQEYAKAGTQSHVASKQLGLQDRTVEYI